METEEKVTYSNGFRPDHLKILLHRLCHQTCSSYDLHTTVSSILAFRSEIGGGLRPSGLALSEIDLA